MGDVDADLSSPSTSSSSPCLIIMELAPLTREAVIQALKGQTLRVPNLKRLLSFPSQPERNPLYPSVRTQATEIIRELTLTQPFLEKRLKDDLGLLTCLWYPTAPLDRLETLVLFTVWLVCWDDAIDANDSDLAQDYDQTEAWRETTLQVAQMALGLGDSAQTIQTNPLNSLLIQTAGHMRTSMTVNQRESFFAELAFFVRSCGKEQRMQLQGVIPSYDSYMDFRLGTVGGGLLCSAIEFAVGETFPRSLVLSPEAQTIRTQVSVCIALLNDILSLKKELRTGCAINAVATLLTPENTLCDVVEDISRRLKSAVKELDEAAETLCNVTKTNRELNQNAIKYIDSCKAILVGTLEFT